MEVNTSEYRRFVSYIYAYPGNVKDKNVGFAKVELRNGQCRLDMTLNGVYMDASKLYGVYLMVRADGECLLVSLGEILVRGGQGKYRDILNPDNMNGSGYTLSDGIGIAVADKEDSYYRMFSLWNDDVFKPENVHYVQQEKPKDTQDIQKDAGIEPEKAKTENAAEDEKNLTEEIKDEASDAAAEVEAAEVKDTDIKDIEANDTDVIGLETVQVKENTLQWLINQGDLIDAFDDDDMYDCVEVSPEQLKKALGGAGVIDGNSFMMHGYYRFHHLLIGRVCENDNNTKYFIGIPGIYCNRERYMASVFGFGNFKKSHRSDYTNPYFGYWYQEM
ncbi:MAG: DUF6128 domain-containing protein [Eubacteriales bacterium]|nr:DUF6128 domain-containing protein [Eubacteriales bacterium]